MKDKDISASREALRRANPVSRPQTVHLSSGLLTSEAGVEGAMLPKF